MLRRLGILKFNILDIHPFLTKKRKFQLIFFGFTMLASAFCEAFSVASLIPFLSILTNPNNLENIILFQYINNFYKVENASQFLVILTIIFCIAILTSGVLRIFNYALSTRLAALIGSDLSYICLKKTLYQPYLTHLSRNTSKVISTITEYIRDVMVAMNAFLQMLTAFVISLFLFLTLFILNINIASSSIFIIAIFYIIVILLVRKRFRFNSLKASQATQETIKSVQEVLGSIRDVLLSGSQDFYLKIFEKPNRLKRIKQSENIFLSSAPKFILESLGIILISIIAFQYSNKGNESSEILPFLGALGLGAQKLLPSCQQIYLNWTTVKGYYYETEEVLTLLKQNTDSIPLKKYIRKLNLVKELKVKNICFSYDKNSYITLDNINLVINKGDRIGIVGKTGSGKSTLLDIMMGLITPDSGEIILDGHNLLKGNKMKNWRAAIAHVPQNIYLVDSSIEENIALGTKKQDINHKLLRDCAKKAQLNDFIAKLPKGYKTFVGERGIKLSGGQKQRIGIARALYKKAKILFLDEATSALDNNTENEFLKAINNLSKDITLVIVAHRLSTIKNCNKVIELNNGRII